MSAYATFFDITHHSLPLAQEFPSRIFCAAETCRLAVVVLSHDYAQSKWPMLELCAFFDAKPIPDILHLFCKLAPGDLNLEQNLHKWRTTWDKFAKVNPSRVDVSKCESAFRMLRKRNGISLNHSEEGKAYIERIFSEICKIRPLSIRHDFYGIQSIHRLSEIILAEFEALDTDQSKVCLMGMYGPLGSSKSTLYRYLHDYLFCQFARKVMHLELPTRANDEELLSKAKQLLTKLTNFNNKMDLSDVSNLLQVYHLLKGTNFQYSKMFLVVDNISSQNWVNFVMALLRLGLAVGSKVLLVACSIHVLRPLLRENGHHGNGLHAYGTGTISVPCLKEDEALRVLLQSEDGVGLPDSSLPEADLTPTHRVMRDVASMLAFKEWHLLLVLKFMGEQLREYKPDVERWYRIVKSFWTEVGLFKEEALNQLNSFRELP